jgi:lysozyme family protein
MSNVPYSPAFEKAIAFILPHENEYARGHWGDPRFVIAEDVDGDNGGVTKYGIDSASHPDVDVASLTEAAAVAIYHGEWLEHDLDALPEKLAVAAMDVWVNGGHANLWLQHGFNELHMGTLTLAEDGILGPQSLADLQDLTDTEIEELLHLFLQERNARFESLASSHANDRQFLAGWEQRDADLAAYLA